MLDLNRIINHLLELDKSNNIVSIELQSDAENSVEINVVYKDYDSISDELWDYTLAMTTEELRIDNFGTDQEIPTAKEILFKRKDDGLC